MHNSITNPISKLLVRLRAQKAKKAERKRINELTKELIQVVKNPQKDAVEKISELVLKGADINTFDMDKERSLLHTAAEQNRMDITKSLIENGCKLYINVNDIYGKDPAFYAIDNNNPELLDYLLAHGVSTKRPADFNLMSSYRYAVLSGNTKLVDIELKHGADVNDSVGKQFILYDHYEKTYPGPTPLAELVAGKEDYDLSSEQATRKIYGEKMIKFLLDKGAKIDIVNPYGNTVSVVQTSENIRKILTDKQQNLMSKKLLQQAKIKSI